MRMDQCLILSNFFLKGTFYIYVWHKVFARLVVSSTNGYLMEHPNAYKVQDNVHNVLQKTD